MNRASNAGDRGDSLISVSRWQIFIEFWKEISLYSLPWITEILAPMAPVYEGKMFRLCLILAGLRHSAHCINGDGIKLRLSTQGGRCVDPLLFKHSDMHLAFIFFVQPSTWELCSCSLVSELVVIFFRAQHYREAPSVRSRSQAEHCRWNIAGKGSGIKGSQDRERKKHTCSSPGVSRHRWDVMFVAAKTGEKVGERSVPTPFTPLFLNISHQSSNCLTLRGSFIKPVPSSNVFFLSSGNQMQASNPSQIRYRCSIVAVTNSIERTQSPHASLNCLQPCSFFFK